MLKSSLSTKCRCLLIYCTDGFARNDINVFNFKLDTMYIFENYHCLYIADLNKIGCTGLNQPVSTLFISFCLISLNFWCCPVQLSKASVILALQKNTLILNVKIVSTRACYTGWSINASLKFISVTLKAY